jgi:predicted lipoprotein with Yx(FWY)xxD motif
VHVSIKFLFPTLAASLLLAACGSSSHSSSKSAASSQPSAASSSGGSTSALVKTASTSGHGTILVNAQGLTLYRLSGERAGKLICTNSACLQVWHPLTVAAGGTPGGSVGSLGVFKRPDGTEQVTYKGMPLYTFAQDQAPGQTKGQGIKDVGTWTVVATSASKARAAAPSKPAAPSAQPPASSTQAPSSGGYGY